MYLKILIIFCLGVKFTYPAPIVEEKIDDQYNKDVEELTYKKYLKEVISLLTMDPEFKKKLLADGKDIVNNPELFSDNLAYVSHGIRTQLDELKRKELDRLRNLLKVKDHVKSKVGIDMSQINSAVLLAHLDPSNPNAFEPKDFDRLIKKASNDLAEIDKRRAEEYKRYEIMKELQKREKFDSLSDLEKEQEIKKYEEMKKKHDDHPKLHHPGNEEHLKTVWADDGMDKEEFDPKTFFYMHDTNGDSFWDENEIEALFQKELDKAYNPEAAEDDMVQRYEEMYRMREHVVNEVDQNRDRVVSLKEFLEYASKKEFKNDEEWETIDSKKVYTEEELRKFEEEKKKIINQAKNKARMNVDSNVVNMQQAFRGDGQGNINHQNNQQHVNVQQQQEIPQHLDSSLPIHDIPEQKHDNQQQQPINNIPSHQDNQQQFNNISLHQDNQQQVNNIPLHQDNQQQVNNIPSHQDNQQQVNNIPSHQDNQHDVPQQQDIPKQHENVPQQQHIPEHADLNGKNPNDIAQEEIVTTTRMSDVQDQGHS